MAAFDPATLERWRALAIVDRNGTTVGTIIEFYLDRETGHPTWALVNTGMFAATHTFIPLVQATEISDGLQVPYEKQHIKDTPRIDPHDELTPDEEAALFVHYGVDYQSSPTPTDAAAAGATAPSEETAAPEPIRAEVDHPISTYDKPLPESPGAVSDPSRSAPVEPGLPGSTAATPPGPSPTTTDEGVGATTAQDEVSPEAPAPAEAADGRPPAEEIPPTAALADRPSAAVQDPAAAAPVAVPPAAVQGPAAGEATDHPGVPVQDQPTGEAADQPPPVLQDPAVDDAADRSPPALQDPAVAEDRPARSADPSAPPAEEVALPDEAPRAPDEAGWAPGAPGAFDEPQPEPEPDRAPTGPDHWRQAKFAAERERIAREAAEPEERSPLERAKRRLERLISGGQDPADSDREAAERARRQRLGLDDNEPRPR
jgi:PRC-barrel domain